MKKTASFLFAVAIMIATPFVLCSCSDDNEEGPTSNGQTDTPDVITPDLDEESMPFVGEWSGWGFYHAPGTSHSKDGIVQGRWQFYNDGTYYWSCTNSYGYPYTERGSWHYIPESRLLVTNGSCGVSWKIEEISDSQWIGTIQTKDGTYIYTKTDTGIEPTDVEVIDYGANRLSVRSAVENIKLANESFKLGVCYGTQDNLEVDTYKKVYADSLDFETGQFVVDVTGLDKKKYRLRCFIELKDGTSRYGDENKAVRINPRDNFVYLGKVNNYEMAVFFAKSALSSSGDFVPIGAYGDKIAWDDVFDFLEEGTLSLISTNEMNFLSSLPMEIKTNDDDGKKYLHISSRVNSNELILPFYDSPSSTWYHTRIRDTNKWLMFHFVENGGKVKLSSEYLTDDKAYALIVMSYSLSWSDN